MKDPTVKISLTVPESVLERVDAVAKTRGDSRSGVVSRMLINGIDGEESLLADMENPVTRTVLDAMASSPRLVGMIARLVGSELSKDELDENRASIREQVKRGRQRSPRPKSGRVGRAMEGI